MNYNYIINFDTLSLNKQALSSIKASISEASSSFSASAKSNVDRLNVKLNKISEDLTKISNALSIVDVVVNDYINNMTTLEGNLTNMNIEGIDAPLEFIGNIETGGFTKNVDDVLMPVITGERENNAELGYVGNKLIADEFYNKYKSGDHRGQCVTGFIDFLKYNGIYDDLKSQGLGVGWAQEYYTNPHNREILQQYFDLVPATSVDELRDGDWLVFKKGSNYSVHSHVGMYYQGKLFGRNQVSSNLGSGNVFTLNNTNLNDLGTNVFVYRLKPGVGKG